MSSEWVLTPTLAPCTEVLFLVTGYKKIGLAEHIQVSI
jgi:hypothetical protein